MRNLVDLGVVAGQKSIYGQSYEFLASTVGAGAASISNMPTGDSTKKRKLVIATCIRGAALTTPTINGNNMTWIASSAYTNGANSIQIAIWSYELQAGQDATVNFALSGATASSSFAVRYAMYNLNKASNLTPLLNGLLNTGTVEVKKNGVVVAVASRTSAGGNAAVIWTSPPNTNNRADSISASYSRESAADVQVSADNAAYPLEFQTGGQMRMAAVCFW